ncbi:MULTISPECIES: PfkB family carbohydrate kinase [unclassified Mesorhizobium]|uniref:PfkB family carbohydrate kinase n=1 Tax=unclassified Mesorhizobium TaxID=325217 RepID=UPI001FD97CFF|nr:MULTISPECIES: PfkB family carbohydrate kinase [unclassified Mesorhizobium]
MAISVLSPDSRLVAYACRGWIDDVRQSMQQFGVTPDLTEIDEDIGFHYFHPLSGAELVGAPERRKPALQANGDVVLRFGMIEGDAIVNARRAIYDPQNPYDVLRFRENGSTADSLAIVLNEVELEASVGLKGEEGARTLMSKTGASVVVAKMGPAGALAVDDRSCTSIPAYASGAVFKIGSGDIFSAVFSHVWGELHQDVATAARAASQAVARYVASRSVQVSLEGLGQLVPIARTNPKGGIYIAAPFFTLPQRWLVEEIHRCLHMLGANSFSPIHDVGSHGTPAFIASEDLRGLEECTAVLAVVDGEDAGTLFEVGYARSLGIPVVALAESPRPQGLTMLEGTGCHVTADFTTAVYQAVWQAAR